MWYRAIVAVGAGAAAGTALLWSPNTLTGVLNSSPLGRTAELRGQDPGESRLPPSHNRTTPILSAIGNTPLLEIPSLSAATGCRILGKAEWMNPGGSIKDR